MTYLCRYLNLRNPGWRLGGPDRARWPETGRVAARSAALLLVFFCEGFFLVGFGKLDLWPCDNFWIILFCLTVVDFAGFSWVGWRCGDLVNSLLSFLLWMNYLNLPIYSLFAICCFGASNLFTYSALSRQSVEACASRICFDQRSCRGNYSISNCIQSNCW